MSEKIESVEALIARVEAAHPNTGRTAEAAYFMAVHQELAPVAWVHSPKKKPALAALSFCKTPTRQQKEFGFVSYPLYARPVPARKVTDAIQAIGRRSTPMRADEGRSPLEFDNGWNQCLDAIERYLKGEGE